MTQQFVAASEAARRLWARNGGDATTPEGVAAAAERVFAQLQTGLARWIGAEGFRALWGRALGLARPAHPALRGLSGEAGGEQAVVAAGRAHGAGDVAAGMIAVIATLIDLLGRIIGDEMAVRLVEQTGAPSRRGEPSIERQGARDG